MANIKYPIDKERDPVEGQCHLCGGPSKSYWMCRGAMFFEVCCTCALEKLPLIIADAIPLGMEGIESASAKMQGSFWRGLALRLMRENKELRSKAAPETGNS